MNAKLYIIIYIYIYKRGIEEKKWIKMHIYIYKKLTDIEEFKAYCIY